MESVPRNKKILYPESRTPVIVYHLIPSARILTTKYIKKRIKEINRSDTCKRVNFSSFWCNREKKTIHPKECIEEKLVLLHQYTGK